MSEPTPPAEAAEPQPRDPNRGRMVLQTMLLWIAAHLLLLGALGLPGYATCHSTTISGMPLSGCGSSLGLLALGIGWLQLVYGLGIGALFIVIGRSRRTAIAQGIFIASGAVTFLFTALCFGAAGNG